MNILKIAVIGIVGVILAVQLKEYRSGYAMYLSLAIGLVISAWTVTRLDTVLQMIHQVQGLISIPTSYLLTLVKLLGITYVSDFGAGLCKDAGHGAVAHQIEIFGKLSILAVSMPVLSALIETIETLL